MRKGGDELTKAKLMYLLVIASLLAYILACVHPGWGMSNGGGF
jgi:hypothetical protein